MKLHALSRLWLMPAVLVASGCDADPLEPGTGDDPGTGTGTLKVWARASGGPNGAVFLVYVYRSGAPVTEANVTITTRSGRHLLSADIRFPGKWSGVPMDEYEQVYVLDVESGTDVIRDVRVDGPPPVVISSPAENSLIDPAAPVEIQWEPAMPDEFGLHINPQGTGLDVADVGSFTIPPDTVVPGISGTHAIGLSRTNRVIPAGAAEDSIMMVEATTYLHVCDRIPQGTCP